MPIRCVPSPTRLDLDQAERATLSASVPSGRTRALRSTAEGEPGVEVPETARIVVPSSALAGRSGEISSILALLRSGRRVVTLTGPGGVGKTRLALEVASRLWAEFSGACVVVELADVRSPGLVLPRLAQALGYPEAVGSDAAATLVPVLSGRRVLVVLDNLEHLLGCAPAVADLVTRCPDLIVVATSRAPLRIRAEHEVVVSPLDVPAAGASPDLVRSSPAVSMFLERSAATGTQLAVTADNADTIGTICRRLGGLRSPWSWPPPGLAC